MPLRHEYDSPPFREKVIFKTFEKKRRDEIAYIYGLESVPYLLRRFTDTSFDEKSALMQDAYSGLSGFEHLGVPRFLAIRANIFNETDSRLQTHYVLVEQIQGKNIQRQKIEKGKRHEAAQTLSLALSELSQYIKSVYNQGGYYNYDQQFHQYVFGHGVGATEPKLYYVDIDHRFIRRYNAQKRNNPDNQLFFDTLVSMNGELIIFIEEFLVHEKLTLARSQYRDLLVYFIQNNSHYSDLVLGILKDFETAYEKSH